MARILREERERLRAPDAAKQLVPGQAKGFDPLLERGTEAGAIGCPPGLAAVCVNGTDSVGRRINPAPTVEYRED